MEMAIDNDKSSSIKISLIFGLDVKSHIRVATEALSCLAFDGAQLCILYVCLHLLVFGLTSSVQLIVNKPIVCHQIRDISLVESLPLPCECRFSIVFNKITEYISFIVDEVETLIPS